MCHPLTHLTCVVGPLNGLSALNGCECGRVSSSVMPRNERAAVQRRSKMSSTEATNGISRRAVLAGAAAIRGECIGYRSDNGAGSAIRRWHGRCNGRERRGRRGRSRSAAHHEKREDHYRRARSAGLEGSSVPSAERRHHLEQRVRSCQGRDARLCTQLSGRPLAGLLPCAGEPAA